MAAPSNPQRARLASRLRALRAATGLSGNRFAERIGWLQSRVSKLETGKQLPTERDIQAWVQATEADTRQAAELVELLTAARIEYATWRQVQDRTEGGLGAHQAQYAIAEAAAEHIARYQPAMLPGLVQTAPYARELLALPGGPLSAGASRADVERLIAERIRRQEILYQPGRTIQIVIGEAALRNAPGLPETMAGQRDRLVAISGLTTVELGVLPDNTMPIMPLSGFSIDDDLVRVETLTGEQQIRDPEEVTVYRQAFDELRAAAATGDDAIALIRASAIDLQNRS